MADKILAIDDPADLLLEDVRQRAIAAAEEMLAHKGVTVEECAAIGTRPTKPVRPGTIPSFFCGMGEVAAAWLEAMHRRAGPVRAGREAAYCGQACAAAALTGEDKPALAGLRG